jgi:hypothetical protein
MLVGDNEHNVRRAITYVPEACRGKHPGILFLTLRSKQHHPPKCCGPLTAGRGATEMPAANSQKRKKNDT